MDNSVPGDIVHSWAVVYSLDPAYAYGDEVGPCLYAGRGSRGPVLCTLLLDNHYAAAKSYPTFPTSVKAATPRNTTQGPSGATKDPVQPRSSSKQRRPPEKSTKLTTKQPKPNYPRGHATYSPAGKRRRWHLAPFRLRLRCPTW